MNAQRNTFNENRWLTKNYGSRSGFVKTIWHQFLYYPAYYHPYKKIDWSHVDRLVFVCKGNICRSAFAEAIARSFGIEAISCGLDTIEDAPANKRARLTAKNLGVDLEGHKTRPIMYLVLKQTDLIVAMEPWQAAFLNKHLIRTHQVTLLGLWVQPVLPHIQDPYGASSDYFNSCFKYIEKSVHALTEKIQK